MKPTSTHPQELHDQPPFDTPKQSPPGLESKMDPQADHGDLSYTGSGRLEGRRALVTGADSGIGRAVAIAFAREGADVAISYLNEHQDAEETDRLVKEAGRKSVLIPGDLSRPDDRRKIVDEARNGLGGIDILVNNAAYQRSYEKFEEIPADEFEETFRVNVFAMFRLCQMVSSDLEPGSSIINTASIQSFDPSPGLIAYAASKAAIASFTSSLAGLLADRGVRVNAVAPGPVWTPLIPATLPAEKVEQFGKNTIFKRPAQPVEMAPIFVFLASDEASYVSGEVYGATGGRMPV